MTSSEPSSAVSCESYHLLPCITLLYIYVDLSAQAFVSCVLKEIVIYLS